MEAVAEVMPKVEIPRAMGAAWPIPPAAAFFASVSEAGGGPWCGVGARLLFCGWMG